MDSESLTSYDFFKIILDKVVPNKLELPEKFVRVNGSSVANSVTLKTPCGSEWKVSVLKRNGQIWLHNNGWIEFANHFSIAFGDLLFFRYKRNSIFKVSICDKSTCQIDYQIQSRDLQEEEEDSEGKNHGSGSWPHNPFFNRTVHASMVHKRYYFQLPTIFWKNHLDGKTGHVILEDSVGNNWPVEMCTREKDRQRPFFNRNDWAAFAHDNKLAVGEVCRFELIRKVTLKVSISRAPPTSHSDTESSHETETLMELNSDNQSSSGSERSIERPKQYKAAVSNDDLGSKKPRPRPKKIANSKASGSEDYLGSKQRRQNPGRPSRDTAAFLEASKFKSPNPCFSAVVANGPNYHLHLHTSFGKSCFGKKNEMVTLQAGLRSWLVKLVFGQWGYNLSSGFSKFVTENSLLPGDVCVYELIKRNNVVLKVHIFRNKG